MFDLGIQLSKLNVNTIEIWISKNVNDENLA